MRGMARQGPMERYTRMVNTMANTGCTRLASLSRPPACATATTPAMGRPTALTARPAKAGQRFTPACAPRCGGKIRFPAPKNMENSVKLTKSRLLPESFCIGQTPHFFLSCIKDDRDSYSSVYRFIDFMSRKKNMKKSNGRHDKLLCIMMHGSLAFGKRCGMILIQSAERRPFQTVRSRKEP